MSGMLVLGRGRSGLAAGALAGGACGAVTYAEAVDLVVASPGIKVVSELQYGCEALRRRGVRLLAVTGSKGKSSVVKLVADALNAAGHHAVACGNYGVPASEVALRAGVEWAVVEVSSFQLETTHLAPDTFEAAVVLNLQEDHLDRHGSVSVYHALKLGLLAMAKRGYRPDALAACADDPSVRRLLAGSYFDNAILRANGAAGVLLLRAAGLADEAIATALRSFQPLPHRMQVVCVRKGVTFIDDSKATSLAALGAGVTMATPPVRLIAGGLPKGDDPKSVAALLTNRVKKVYLIGQSADQLHKAWSTIVDCEVCGTMTRAVAAVTRDAEEGDTVLMSPGAASYDQFENFEKRGEVFAELVEKEG